MRHDILKVEIHDLAAKEFDDAIDWYEMQAPGLGERFKKQNIRQINKIKNNPTWFLIEQDDLYKAFVPKFPYKILYTIEDQRILVWAISHLHRKPWYWQSRLK